MSNTTSPRVFYNQKQLHTALDMRSHMLRRLEIMRDIYLELYREESAAFAASESTALLDRVYLVAAFEAKLDVIEEELRHWRESVLILP